MYAKTLVQYRAALNIEMLAIAQGLLPHVKPCCVGSTLDLVKLNVAKAYTQPNVGKAYTKPNVDKPTLSERRQLYVGAY